MKHFIIFIVSLLFAYVSGCLVTCNLELYGNWWNLLVWDEIIWKICYFVFTTVLGCLCLEIWYPRCKCKDKQ
jgi:hypothetical protein